MRRVERMRVVSPAVASAERIDRHELDDVHAEIGERVELRGRAREGAAERAEVHLVDDGLLARRRRERAGLPHVRAWVDDHGLSRVDGTPARVETLELAP